MRELKEFKRPVDPRLALLNKRLEDIKRVIAVASGKGGVGKTLISSTLSLALVRKGCDVGLLDLDFHGPSCHIVLGLSKPVIVENKGVLPVDVHGIKFMSLYNFVGDLGLPLRGEDLSNLMVELFTITLWGYLDYLIIDMPPGTGDELLDLIRLIPKAHILIITTPSILSLMTVKRLIYLLKSQKVNILGIVENMSFNNDIVIKLAKALDIAYLGKIPYDEKVEKCLGKPSSLLRTKFGIHVKKLIESILNIMSDV